MMKRTNGWQRKGVGVPKGLTSNNRVHNRTSCEKSRGGPVQGQISKKHAYAETAIWVAGDSQRAEENVFVINKLSSGKNKMCRLAKETGKLDEGEKHG